MTMHDPDASLNAQAATRRRTDTEALAAERKARKAAEKHADALEARLAELQTRAANQASVASVHMAALEARARRADQFQAAIGAGLPLGLADRIRGDTLDEMTADARYLAAGLGIDHGDSDPT